MFKPENQLTNFTFKSENTHSTTQPLHTTNNTKNQNKITKPKPPIIRYKLLPAPQAKVEQDARPAPLLHHQILLDFHNTNNLNNTAEREPSSNTNSSPVPQVEAEQDIDIKPPLKEPLKESKIERGQYFSQVKIKGLTHTFINNKRSTKAASKKTNIPSSCRKAYHLLMPITRYSYRTNTQDQIDGFVGFMINDNMSIDEASAKANISSTTGYRYYRQYVKDHIDAPALAHSQDQLNTCIRYIVDDNMSVTEASKKAKVSHRAAEKEYQQYLKGQKA